MKAFFTTSLLLAGLTAFFMCAGYLIGGQSGAMTALVLAGVMNLGAYWMSDKMVLAQYRAQEVNERTAPNYYAIVRDLAARANLPMPKVYIIQSDQPNAFATGRSPQHAAVAATTGLLQRLSHDEIAGVMAHELAHVKNRDMLTMTIAATLAGALGYLANFGFLFAGNRGEGEQRSPLAPIAMLLVMIVGPMAAMLVQMAISRTREYEADRMGAQICGKPRALASALNNISQSARVISMPQADANPATAHLFIANPLSFGRMAQMFATHPPMEERIRRLLAMDGEVTPAQHLNSTPRSTSQLPRAGGMRGPWG
mgnify:CR=1 FL=1